MQQQFIEYHDAGTVLEGFLARPAKAGERRPAVLVSHAWAGRDDFVIDKAKALAGLGYAAFALDNYGKGGVVASGAGVPTGCGLARRSRMVRKFGPSCIHVLYS